ncbi:hypothetical protein BKA69DRAFT_1129796 [Paraphysoderma sedebokerense]|nr:hypothetical protein BKA69DRAFT_1129796 [Paraphysoderma sedebokerense]
MTPVEFRVNTELRQNIQLRFPLSFAAGQDLMTPGIILTSILSILCTILSQYLVNQRAEHIVHS